MALNNLTRREAADRARLISRVAYRIALDLAGGRDPQAETFGCDAEIDFACAAPASGDLPSTFIEYLGATVERVELNGTELPASSVGGGRIRLDGLQAENHLRVIGRSAYQHTGVGMHRFVDPVDKAVYLYTDSEPYDVHRVYPCFDQPDLKATFEVSVRAPAGWHVSANGPAVAVPDPGTGGWWRFARTAPLSTYISAVVAGDYHVVRSRHGEVDLALLCRRSLAEYLDPDEIFEVTRQGLDFYTAAFAYPYPFIKYDQAFVPEFNAGAMENAGIVTFSERAIFRSRVTEAARESRGDTILHEMAHMWFGDLVTMRWWDDLWLNESFATFMANYALVKATRFTGAWTTFSAGWKTWAYRQDQLPTTHPIVADLPDIESVKVNFDGITYAKGASVLRQLVAWVGEEAFLAGLTVYFRRHAFGTTTLSDFLAALEESSGRDLQTWSKSWLETAGVNTLRPASVVESLPGEIGGTFASFSILQESPADYPALRPHRLAIGLYDAEGDRLVRRRRVELDVQGAETPVGELALEKVPALLVINDDDLAYAKIRLDDASFATLATRLRDVADPLTRALCWAGAWDMTRDAELPTRNYLQLVLGNVAAESQVSVVESQISQLGVAIHSYGDPDDRDTSLEMVSVAAYRHLHEAEAGSDHQLAWARALIGSARAEHCVEVVGKLLDGSFTVEGLAVDTELRWQIVRALASEGRAGEELIAAEEQRDPTDAGRRHGASARAARPTEAAKAEAWHQILDQDLAFATMRALMAGFQQPDQAGLLAPYAERYFDQLGPVFGTRSQEVALAFATGMYPKSLIDQETIAMTDAYIARAGPPWPVRRVLLEARDSIGRALRTRACDIAARPLGKRPPTAR
ncbi:MAG TPA: aminopeptidase N [Actinomycetota bacterium]|nr:aminopeptidase N [Actinomycetota bacterium]